MTPPLPGLIHSFEFEPTGTVQIYRVGCPKIGKVPTQSRRFWAAAYQHGSSVVCASSFTRTFRACLTYHYSDAPPKLGLAFGDHSRAAVTPPEAELNRTAKSSGCLNERRKDATRFFEYWRTLRQ
jgi:hypothetical protein